MVCLHLCTATSVLNVYVFHICMWHTLNQLITKGTWSERTRVQTPPDQNVPGSVKTYPGARRNVPAPTGCWSNRRPPNSPPTRLIARRSARVKAPPGVESIRRRSIFFRYYERITCPRNEFTLMINYLHLWKAVYDSFTIA